jgi:O-methyltransferase involved in polyketide biosynthesis
LDLPSDLTWIEADLPKLLAEKTQLLADQSPRCRLSRTAVDLADPNARDAFFSEALDGATKAFVLTEGLSMYLEYRDITALSGAIKRPEVTWWMLDFAFPGLRKRINKNVAGIAESAPFIFAPENGLAYFEELGWQPIEAESVLEAAYRLHRLPVWMRPLAWLPKSDLRRPGNRPTSAVALLTH